jgi:hypothetical protein
MTHPFYGALEQKTMIITVISPTVGSLFPILTFLSPKSILHPRSACAPVLNTTVLPDMKKPIAMNVATVATTAT